jgi:hypothetical protein
MQEYCARWYQETAASDAALIIDDSLPKEAAAALSRLRAELDDANRTALRRWDEILAQRARADAAEADNKVLREALTAALPYIENLIGYSQGHTPQALLDTKAKIDAALGGQHGQ